MDQSSVNPYLQPAIDAAQGDLVRNFNLTTQPAYNSAMVRSGSFGNAGVQQLNENAQLNLQKSLGDISSGMRNNDYQFNQQFNRSLYNDAYGQNMQNLQTGIGLLDRQQAYDQNQTGNATTIQNTPMNYWQQFSNSANGIGQGFGSSTGTQMGGGSSPWTTALGGAQLGSAAAKQFGWGSGTTWGGGNNYAGTPYNADTTIPMQPGGGW
ncbi:hypothetical protein [Polaromonas sp. JS666]|uniref:hypothetical protein n=1 Tax=Polaromonas sp. (strain JS666 / ATCC BAA-500) TaxID=296591 RepID=UPI000882CA5E|nr:hypothetical protein [Polaromonas sp. JS666]SDN52004.1 hypothetical protein SAMN05720382_105320 [Polaromonas sp. JS666]